MSEYVTHDSGSMSEYEDGMRRDATTGKPMFSLMFPEGVPYEDQMITRLAALYARGAEKYGARNHEKSSTEESLAHHKDAFLRHVFKFLLGVEDGEDHGAAVLWNAIAIDLTRRNIKAKQESKPKEFPLSSKEEIDEAKAKVAAIDLTKFPSTHEWYYDIVSDTWKRVNPKRVMHDAFCGSLNLFQESDCTCGLDGER